MHILSVLPHLSYVVERSTVLKALDRIEFVVMRVAAEHGLQFRVSEVSAFIAEEDEDGATVWAEEVPWNALETALDVSAWVAEMVQQHKFCYRSNEKICGLSKAYIDDVLAEIDNM